jgi:hypothetical protein
LRVASLQVEPMSELKPSPSAQGEHGTWVFVELVTMGWDGGMTLWGCWVGIRYPGLGFGGVGSGVGGDRGGRGPCGRGPEPGLVLGPLGRRVLLAQSVRQQFSRH